MQPRRRVLLLALAGMVAVVFAGLGFASTRTVVGDRLDYLVWSSVLNGLPPWVRQPLDRLARELAPLALAVLVGGLALWGIVRRQWRRVAGAVVIAAIPSVLTSPVHLQDATGPVGGSYPSNHATAALGLLVAVVVLWPRPVRRWGLGVAAATGYTLCLGNVSWYAHAPRDVAGSVLAVAGVVVAVAAALGVRVLNLAEDPPEG